MKTIRLLLLLTITLLGLGGETMAQPWTYDLGTGTGSFTSTTASTAFMPAPGSGTARVRVGTNPGSFVLANPGVTGLGTGTELQMTSNTGSTSTTKFSVHDYTTGKSGYVKFKISFRGGTNGVYNFSLGDGATFSDNNALSNNQVFAGLRWSMGASNAITYNVLNNTTYGTTGISNAATLFTQDTTVIYSVEIYANNSNASIDYVRSSTTYSLAADTWDLWVDGTRVGTGLASGALGNDANMDSWAFNHQVSASTPGTIYLDDIEYSNSLPVNTNPTVNVSPGSHGFGNLAVGNNSAGQTFSITGSNLTGAPGNIAITPPNNNFEVSTDNVTFGTTINIPYATASLSSTNFYVRFSPQSGGEKTGNLGFAGGGLTTTPTISLTGTGTTASTASNVIIAAGFTEPDNIAYGSFQATDITDANSVEVARFTLQDGGNGLNDADALSTTLTAITFNVNNHANLRRIALYDGTTELGEVAAGATAAFSSLSAAAADNGSKNLTIRVTFAASVTDRAQISFTVASVTANGSGSLFAAADGGAAVSSTTGDRNKIQVTATVFAFVQQPSNAGSGNNMSPAVTVSANDALGNRDTDFTGNVQITSTGTLTGTPVIQAAASGLATFSTLVHTGTGTGLKLTAARNPEADRTVESSTFNLVQLPAVGEIVINQFSQDYSGASDEYVELVNKTNKSFDLSLLKLGYQSSTGSAGGAGGNLTGTLAPYSFWLLSPNATVTVGLTSGLARDGAITAGFAASAGQMAVQIISDNTIIDAVGYGTITGGTFTEGGNGAAMTAPSSDGGGKRTTDGADTNNNGTDFSTVANANIYLRNSGSRLALTGASIPAGDFTDLVVTGNASLSGAVNLSNRLELISGVLTTNSNLTFLSTAANDAANVIGGTNASVSGNVTVQRFFPWASANNNGFRFVSHPFSSNPQLSAISGLPAGANTVIGYDEDLSTTQGGYISLNDRSITLGQAKSMGVWTNASTTITYTGPLQLDAIASVAVDFAGTSTGWNFMGNPFPNTLDWNEVTKSATVNNATYVWIKDNLALGGGTWGTYINGTAANGGSRYLAVGQGFVVKATGTSPAPTLGFPTASRVTNQNPNFNVTASLPDELRLRVNRWDNGTRFETIVKFAADATENFDATYDAEMMSDSRRHTPDLYTRDANGNKYTIQTLPMPSGEHQMMPLQLETFGAGSFSFDVDLSKLRALSNVELQDTKLNTFTTLVNNSQIIFQTDTNDAIGRFVLHFNRAARTHSTVSVAENIFAHVNVYSYENEIFVRGLEWADQLRIMDLTGRVVFEIQKPDFTSGTIRPNLAAGTYLVNLSRQGVVKTVKVVLQ